MHTFRISKRRNRFVINTNPYSPPNTRVERTRDSATCTRRFAYSKGLLVASTVTGGLVTAIAIYAIYVDDPRTGVRGPTLQFSVFMGTLLSSVVWCLSGWLQRRGIPGLLITFILAAASAGLWIAVGGTYADVLGAAACAAWPLGGLIVSLAIYSHAKFEHTSRSRPDVQQ